MRPILFAMFLMLSVSCASLPPMGFCLADFCISITDTGAEVRVKGRVYACDFDVNSQSAWKIKVDVDAFNATGEIMIDANGKKIICSVR